MGGESGVECEDDKGKLRRKVGRVGYVWIVRDDGI